MTVNERTPARRDTRTSKVGGQLIFTNTFKKTEKDPDLNLFIAAKEKPAAAAQPAAATQTPDDDIPF